MQKQPIRLEMAMSQPILKHHDMDDVPLSPFPPPTGFLFATLVTCFPWGCKTFTHLFTFSDQVYDSFGFKLVLLLPLVKIV